MSRKLFTFVTDIQLEPILKHRVYILYISTQQCPEARDTLLLHIFFLRLSPGPHTSISHRIYTERERQKIFSPTGHVRNHTMHISAPCHETLEGKMGSIFVNPWCGVGPFYLAFLGGGNSQMYTFPSSFFSPV